MSRFEDLGNDTIAPGKGVRGNRQRLLEVAAVSSVLAVALVLYREAFLGFFVQDDFGWLLYSRFPSLTEYAKSFFRFNPWGSYRPLSQDTFFWLGQKIFGMWPLGFHVVSVTAHLAASALAYLLLRRFFGVFPSSIAALLYAAHPAHLISVYWISAVTEPLAMVFLLSALLSFIRFDRAGDLRAYVLSLAAMVLGIMSKESALPLPLVLAAYSLLFAQSRLRWTIPYFSFTGLYILFRMTSHAVPTAPYELTFGKEVWENLLAYLSWMAGANDSVLRSGMHWDVPSVYRLLAAGFVGVVLMLVLFSRNRRVAVFAIVWMVFALQPVLYFSRHAYAYYLAPALAAFSLLIASVLRPIRGFADWKAWSPAVGMACIILCSTYAAAQLEGRWIIQRTFLRRDFVKEIQTIDRNVPDGRTAYIFGLKPEEFESLENGAIFKAYGLSVSKFRFILPGLDPDLSSTLRQLKTSGSLGNAYCFVLSAGEAINETESFRKAPDRFFVDRSLQYHEVPGIRLEASPEIIQSGKDILTLRVVNLEVPAMDLLYSINGQLMPPVLHWLLNAEHTTTVFADATTPKGRYQFKAIRDSRKPRDSDWIKIDASVTVR